MAQASAESRLNLAPGSELHGFAVERVESIPEIEGTAYIMRHRTSGTPLMWLANDDENMAFAIAFKTPPADDTGVFHILEHSVLCGSDRYPVKEPFVDLLKTSMQTFLNALTFSDKTMYPVASTNEQDLLNLMDVYMDAVLHPALYTKPTIFEQEGWHYEVDGLPAGDEGEDEATAPAAPNLRYNGVVFNERKGALSDPDEAVLDGLSAALFPQTAYRFVSGGHPRAIPTLTYDSYKDTHARHYNLENAKAVLYGDISLDRELAWLDERYMACAQEPAGAPNPLELQPAVVNMDAVTTLATSPDNAAVALGYVAGTYADRERSLALEILSDALMGSNEAPLKRELLEADLGADVDAFVYDGLLQPFFVLELRGADEGAAQKFTELVDGAFARMAVEGVPRENLEAALESAAFSLRERDFGYADGVALAINAMCGWLYSDEMPTDYLRYEEALANLKAGLDTGYWERLVREVFVESTHRARCVLVPVAADAPESMASQEAAELAAAQASMDAARLESIAAEADLLHRLQAEPDSPEATATLPRLAVADIGAPREEPGYGLVENTPLPCLYHEVPTRRIDYVYHYFDLVGLTWDELPYVTLACSLLGKMDTASHSAAELDTLIESRLGRLGFQAVVHEDAVSGEATPRLMVGASAIAENVADLATIPTEVWATTDFSDVEKIRRVLQQQRIDSEQAFTAAGNSYAMARAFGYTSKNSLLAQHFGDVEKIRRVLQQQRIDSEQAFTAAGNSYAMARAFGYTSKNSLLAQHFGNVDYYRFVRDLLERWDEHAPVLPQVLADICRRVFVAGSSLTSFTGERSDLDRFWRVGGQLGLSAPAAEHPAQLVVPEPTLAREAFVISSDICFVAKACDAAHTGATYAGIWSVAARALNYGYLWDEIRVQGGAYGCGFRPNANGSMGYYTYRDPNLDASLARIDAAGAWLRAYEPDRQTMEGYIVSTVAGHDAPQRPRMVARRQDVDFLTHRDPAWRDRIRQEELEATAEQLQPLADALDAVAARDAVCVFGSREILERSEAGLQIVELM